MIDYENVCVRHSCTKNRVSSTRSPGAEGYFEDYYECPACAREQAARKSLRKVGDQWK